MRGQGKSLIAGLSIAACMAAGSMAFHEPYDGGPYRPRTKVPKKKSAHKRKHKGSKAAKKNNRR
jgi:hypothetical protein